MAKRRVSKSKKQYVQSVNTAAMDVVRNLEGAKGAPMPEYIEPLLAKLRDHPPTPATVGCMKSNKTAIASSSLRTKSTSVATHIYVRDFAGFEFSEYWNASHRP
jgi:hypothetical protein